MKYIQVKGNKRGGTGGRRSKKEECKWAIENPEYYPRRTVGGIKTAKCRANREVWVWKNKSVTTRKEGRRTSDKKRAEVD